MLYNIEEFKNKQIVSVETGAVLGYVNEIEIDAEKGTVANIVVFGKQRLFGVLGREEDMQIPWENIEVIGNETILVKGPVMLNDSKRKRL